MNKKYRGVILDGHHWHLQSHVKHIHEHPELADRMEITAISGMGSLPNTVVDEFHVPRYDAYLDLLDNESCDFAYVFGTHRGGVDIIAECIKRDIPFIAEKPCAVEPAALEPLVREVQKKRLVHLVPLWRRYSSIVVEYKEFIRQKMDEGPLHFHFRYITGSPARYDNADCSWGNRRYPSGGGCLMNLGSHYIDLVRFLSRDEIVSVHAVVNTGVWETEVEDYAVLVLKTQRGATASIEVGFTKPGTPYELYNVSGKDFYLSGETDVGTRLHLPDGSVKESTLPGGNRYDLSLAHLLDMMEGIEVPDECTLADQLECVKVIDAAYRSASFRV
jgi:predicted dehydrogenase